MSNTNKKLRLLLRKRRSRAKVFGTAQRPRISVYRSLTGLYVQAIDDENGNTLVAVSNKEIEKKEKNNIETARAIGKLLADKCIKKKINKAVFDRGGYKYHGKIKAVADGAREGKLEF